MRVLLPLSNNEAKLVLETLKCRNDQRLRAIHDLQDDPPHKRDHNALAELTRDYNMANDIIARLELL